jgi:hypothetical protein
MKKKAVAKRTAAVKTETSSKRPPRQKESGLGQVHDAAVVLNTITPPAPAMHADVRQRAMLVNLTVHQWLANTTDKKITNEVAEHHGIDASMGRYQKTLLSKEALEKMKSTGQAARNPQPLHAPLGRMGHAHPFLEGVHAVQLSAHQSHQRLRAGVS